MPNPNATTLRRKSSPDQSATMMKAGARSVAPPAGEPDAAPRTGSVDHVAAEILRALYEGRLVPGQKLLESDITRRLGVGRGSVREALRRLETEGLVTSSLHRGASIRRLTRDEASDLLEVNETLLGLCARFAAERIPSPDRAAPLRAAVTALGEHVANANSYGVGRSRWAFIEALVTLSGNDELARLLLRLEPSIVRTQFRAAYDLEHHRLCLETFERVVEFVVEGDGKKAEQALRRYVRATSAAIQSLPEHHFAA